MPKERRDRSVSLDRSKVFPFPCNSSSSRMKESTNPSELAEDIKEWEEARCPVCMEHPHNAVLLLCSSHDKGCHPYMCDTSYRHSNCLDQFRKAFAAVLPSISAESSPNIINFTHSTNQEQHSVPPPMGEGQEILLPCNEQEKPKLSCPLCRGSIKGWIVVERARQFMNAKTRSCSSELCPFSGPYTDLRKHARMEHPLARPTEVDQNRQRNWRRLERQRDLGDVLSTIQSAFDDDRSSLDDEDSFPVVGDDGGWLTVYFLIRVFRSSDSSWSSVPSRLRGMSRSRRRTTLWGESYDHGESASREDNSNNALEGVSGSWHSEHSRSVTPENDE